MTLFSRLSLGDKLVLLTASAGFVIGLAIESILFLHVETNMMQHARLRRTSID